MVKLIFSKLVSDMVQEQYVGRVIMEPVEHRGCVIKQCDIKVGLNSDVKLTFHFSNNSNSLCISDVGHVVVA